MARRLAQGLAQQDRVDPVDGVSEGPDALVPALQPIATSCRVISAYCSFSSLQPVERFLFHTAFHGAARLKRLHVD